MRLVEQVALPGRRGLDKENRVARDVLVLRPRMQAGRRFYSEAARQELARLITEKRPQVLEDHALAGVPPVEAVLGYLEAGRVDSEGAVRADFRYRVTTAARVEDIIENLSEQVGFSVHITGYAGPGEQGVETVISVSAIESVDIVSRPSHAGGIFEALDDHDAAVRADYLRAITDTTPAFQPAGSDEPSAEPDDDARRDYEKAAAAPDRLRL